MNRARMERHLLQANGRVVFGETVVCRQRKIITELERRGLDSDWAIRLLENFERTLQIFIVDRDRTERELAQLLDHSQFVDGTEDHDMLQRTIAVS